MPTKKTISKKCRHHKIFMHGHDNKSNKTYKLKETYNSVSIDICA
jgi:hypothetical protein